MFSSRTILFMMFITILTSTFSPVQAAEESYQPAWQKEEELFKKLFTNTEKFTITDVIRFINQGGNANAAPGNHFTVKYRQLGIIGELPLLFWVLILAKLPIEQKRNIVEYLLKRLKESGQLPITNTVPESRFLRDDGKLDINDLIDVIGGIAQGDNILHIAARLNDQQIVEELLLQGAATQDMRDAQNARRESAGSVAFVGSFNPQRLEVDYDGFHRSGQNIGRLIWGWDTI